MSARRPTPRELGTNPRVQGTNARAQGRNPRETDPFATADLTVEELQTLDYAQYRRTKHWRMTRRRIVKRAGGQCEKCGEKRRLEVHHLTYDHLGHEHDDELEALCRDCHQAEHTIVTADSGGWLVDTEGRKIGVVLEVVIDLAGEIQRGVDPSISSVYRETSPRDGVVGETRSALDEQIATVWAHYVEVMKPRRTELDPEARRVIADALKVATAAECCGAIDGCKASPFHMGSNDRRTKYNRLTQILKGKRPSAQGPGRTTREQIDLFLDIAAKCGVGSGVTSADPARVRQAKRDVLDAEEFPGDEQVVKRGEESAAWLATHGIERTGDRWVTA